MVKIEQVARAILSKVPSGYGMTASEAEDYARAAIEAMHNPTKAMKLAGAIPTREIQLGNGTTATGLGLGADFTTMWERGIDAALKEGAK